MRAWWREAYCTLVLAIKRGWVRALCGGKDLELCGLGGWAEVLVLYYGQVEGGVLVLERRKEVVKGEFFQAVEVAAAGVQLSGLDVLSAGVAEAVVEILTRKLILVPQPPQLVLEVVLFQGTLAGEREIRVSEGLDLVRKFSLVLLELENEILVRRHLRHRLVE